MTHAGYVFAGWILTAAVLAVYVAWLLARLRRLQAADRTEGAPPA